MECFVYCGGEILEGYITTREASEKWNISIRQVQNYCKRGIIPDVEKFGKNYMIPKNSLQPKYGFHFLCEISSVEDNG